MFGKGKGWTEMHKRFAALILAVVLMIPAVSALGGTEDCLRVFVKEGYFDTQMARDMLPMINAFRTGNDAWYWNEDNTYKVTCSGLSELRYDYGLEKAAMQRAVELAFHYDHDRPDGSRCFTAYPSQGVSMGENIAYGYFSTQSMFDGWAEENYYYAGQGHRRNMLSNNYACVGVACFRMGNTCFWAQEFSSSGTNDANSNPLPMPVAVDVYRSYVKSLVINEAKLGLQQNTELSLSEIPISVSMNNGRNINCSIQGLTWSTSNSSVAAISNGVVTGRNAGTAALTASVGGFSAQLDVKVIKPISMKTSIRCDQPFDDQGYAAVYLTFDNVAGAEYYIITSQEVESGWSDSFTAAQAGTKEIYLYHDDNVHPIHCTYTIQAIDEEGYRIASAKQYAVVYQKSGVLSLPARTKTVESEAFRGTNAYCVIIPNGCTSIGDRAFAYSPNLCSVRIPSSVTSISGSAFDGCPSDMIIETASGSKAEQFAVSRGYTLFLTK